MFLSGAEILIKTLENFGVRVVTGMPGGTILPVYDALYHSKIQHIQARHEQGGGFIAQGMARMDGIPAVTLATSGPGAMNLMTALADARLDSIPLLAITGQVPRALRGTDAFQEVDTCAVAKSITRAAFYVDSVESLPDILMEAWDIAQGGRPGPVLLDIPKDVQQERVEIDALPTRPPPRKTGKTPPPAKIAAAHDMIQSAKKPIFFIGGGMINSNGSALLRKIAREANIPTASTLNGLGAFPPEDPLSLGMVGMHGSPAVNMALEETDLLIALGVRFDDRATGRITEFCPRAKIIHVDIDPREPGRLKPCDLALIGDVKIFLNELERFGPLSPKESWAQSVTRLKREFPLPDAKSKTPLHPAALLPHMAALLPEENTVLTTDVGQHQMWVAQYYPFRRPRTLLTSGGLGTMGFGLPVAIGAALKAPDKTVICISGDGSFLLNIQELALLAELNLNVKVLIFNNQRLGMVRQQQELFYEQRLSASRFAAPLDFAALGQAFGLPGFDLAKEEYPLATLEEALGSAGPAIINVPLDPVEMVLPMVPAGAPNREMIMEAPGAVV